LIIVDLFVNEVWNVIWLLLGILWFFLNNIYFCGPEHDSWKTGLKIAQVIPWKRDLLTQWNKSRRYALTGWFTTHVFLSCELIVSQVLSFLISFWFVLQFREKNLGSGQTPNLLAILFWGGKKSCLWICYSKHTQNRIIHPIFELNIDIFVWSDQTPSYLMYDLNPRCLPFGRYCTQAIEQIERVISLNVFNVYRGAKMAFHLRKRYTFTTYALQQIIN